MERCRQGRIVAAQYPSCLIEQVSNWATLYLQRTAGGQPAARSMTYIRISHWYLTGVLACVCLVSCELLCVIIVPMRRHMTTLCLMSRTNLHPHICWHLDTLLTPHLVCNTVCVGTNIMFNVRTCHYPLSSRQQIQEIRGQLDNSD